MCEVAEAGSEPRSVSSDSVCQQTLHRTNPAIPAKLCIFETYPQQKPTAAINSVLHIPGKGENPVIFGRHYTCFLHLLLLLQT